MKFHGTLGLSRIDKVFSVPKLRIFDLSHNEFIGPLPTNYFPSLNAMTNANPTIPAEFWQYMGEAYYDDSVVITLKGVDIEFQRILKVFSTIDFSSNRFQGETPDDIGSLLGSYSLNLSNNALTGHILSSLANLRLLESLDPSSNNPNGPIPRGFQFDTFQNDSYIGNLGLCGPPLSKKCLDNGAPHEPSQEDDEEGIFNGFGWKIVMLGYGCGTVFGLGVGFVMFSSGKPERLMTFVEEVLLRMAKRTGKRPTQDNRKCIKMLQK